MAQRKGSLATAFFEIYGPEKCREYIKRPADGCPLYRCESGHDDCAHIKRGPCLRELTQLVEAMS